MSRAVQLFPGFVEATVRLDHAELAVLQGGTGPGLLLLHGFPQTRAAWHRVAPRLARHFAVVVPDRIGHRELLLPSEPVAQGLALHVRHHLKEIGVGRARIEQREDVRVLQVGGEPNLGQEALGADHRRKLGPQNFQRHPPVVPNVVSHIHGRHAPGADLTLQPLSVGQGGLKPGKQLGHRAWDVGGVKEDAAGRPVWLGGAEPWTLCRPPETRRVPEDRREIAPRMQVSTDTAT
jgi:hypothetical protein